MRKLALDGLDQLTLGAALLANGGGGDPFIAKLIGIGERVIRRWRMRGTSVDRTVAGLDVPGCSVVTAYGGKMTNAFLYYDGEALDTVLQTAGEGA